MDRVKLNVSGTHFEFDKKILQDGKSPKLTKICSGTSQLDSPPEVTADCSPVGFGAILSYYQTGELHIPPGVCPGAFRRELDFWEVDFDFLQECCMFRYQAFLHEEKTRKTFLHKALPPTTVIAPAFVSTASVMPSTNGFKKSCRAKVWRVIDNNEATIIAKLYFVMISALVVVSICVLAYSTEPSMRRHVSKCELLDYLERVHFEELEMVKQIVGNPDCSNGGSWLTSGDWDLDDLVDLHNYNWTYYKSSSGSQLKKPNKGGSSNSQINDTSAQGGASSTDPNDPYEDGDENPESKKINIPRLTVPKPAFGIADIAVNIVFTIDFILRIWSCPSWRRYFMSVINVLDAVALLSTYTYIIIVSIERRYFYEETSWLYLLEFLQVFRALRLFRVVKNVRASKVLAYALTQDVKDMTLLVTLLFVGVSTFAYLFYCAETRDTVSSIPTAWYWAIVTMTTVGYGDISPKSGFGRVISSLCAISGVLLLSVTLPMFVNNFLTLYQYSCVNESIEKRREGKEKKIKGGNQMKPDGNTTNGQHVQISKQSEISRPPSYETSLKYREKTRENVTDITDIQDL